MFAPTEVAADRFLALFTRDGCTTISKKRLKEVRLPYLGLVQSSQ